MNPRKTALVFIFITLFLDLLGMGLVVPILPKRVEELAGGGVDHATYLFGWLVGLYAPMQFLFAPIIGSLSDRFGRRLVILTSLFGSGLGDFLLARAPLPAVVFPRANSLGDQRSQFFRRGGLHRRCQPA